MIVENGIIKNIYLVESKRKKKIKYKINPLLAIIYIIILLELIAIITAV